MSRFPFPLYKGDKLRAYHQITTLSKHADVYLIALSDENITENSLLALQPFCKDIKIFRLSLLSRLYHSLFALIKMWPLQLGYFYNHKIQKAIHHDIQRIEPDVVYAQLARTYFYIKDIKFKKVLDFQDCFSENYRRLSMTSNWFKANFYRVESKRLSKIEKEILDTFDNTTIISKRDQLMLPPSEKSCTIVSNGVDESFFTSPQLDKKYDILFVGNLSYEPNIQAVSYLAQHIVPLLLVEFPLLKVAIVGASPSQKIISLANKNVQIVGFVEDVKMYYAASKVFVAPIFSGGGLQNKILEAMAIGLPCVTTPLVNESLHAQEGKEILVADTALDFCNKIKLLLVDTAISDAISKQAKQKMMHEYRWEEVNKTLLEVLLN